MDPRQRAAVVKSVAETLRADPDILIAWDTFDKLDTRIAKVAVTAVEAAMEKHLKKAS